jgi:hypothetical protein
MPEEILETPQPIQSTESKHLARGQSSSGRNWPKIILAAVLGFGLLAGAAYAGYWYGTQEISNLKNQISKLELQTKNQTTPTPEPAPSPTSSEEHIYKNEEYNFKFSYPQDWYFENKLESSFELEEKGSQIIITETVYGTGVIIPKVYTIYEASAQDKNDLVSWWKKNIKTEIGDHKVPTDYDTALNRVPFDVCIQAFDKSWQLPPALEVTPKEGIEEPGPYKGSIYFYYDFGKPFILNFTEESTGACGTENGYKVFTSISKLH